MKNGLFTLFQIMSAIRGATRLRRGGKSRKGRKNKGAGLSQDDIEYLTKNTKYDETEIKEWYKGFKVCFVLVLLLLFVFVVAVFVVLLWKTKERVSLRMTLNTQPRTPSMMRPRSRSGTKDSRFVLFCCCYLFIFFSCCFCCFTLENKGVGLSQDDIEYLIKNNKYDETKIKEWYKGFKVCFVLVLLLLFFFSCCFCCFTLEN
jgi:hypothetical protein